VSDRFDPDERVAAEELDRVVDDALAAGPAPGVDPQTSAVLRLLADAHRDDPTAGTAARIGARMRRAEERRWLPGRIAAAVLGAAFLAQGLGNLFAGRWVARHVDVPFDSHAFFEGGIALLALGAILFAAAFARRWLDLAVAAGVPAALALALHGAPEVDEFPAGGVLHLTQGVAALALLVLWWRARRYVLPPRANRGREQ
jgi:MFS family permease